MTLIWDHFVCSAGFRETDKLFLRHRVARPEGPCTARGPLPERHVALQHVGRTHQEQLDQLPRLLH